MLLLLGFSLFLLVFAVGLHFRNQAVYRFRMKVITAVYHHNLLTLRGLRLEEAKFEAMLPSYNVMLGRFWVRPSGFLTPPPGFSFDLSEHEADVVRDIERSGRSVVPVPKLRLVD